MHDLPAMPIAGALVAGELTRVCTEESCLHLNNWLNELYLFNQEDKIYKRDYEISKHDIKDTR